MRYSCHYQFLNQCDQTVVGSVESDAATLTIKELGEKDCRLYFTNKEEIITVIEILSEMSKNMEDK